MPGFNPNKPKQLDFSGTPYDGAEVWVRMSANLGRYLEIEDMLEKEDKTTEDVIQYWCDEILLKWNIVDDEDQELPPNYESMKLLGIDFALTCMHRWRVVTGAIPAPLEMPSTNGQQSPEVSMPKDELSASLASLSAPN